MESLEKIYEYLTEDQRKGFDFILDFIKPDNTDLFALLTGVAGSGKTTIISLFIQYFKETFPHLNIACTATTNKAVKVLRTKVANHLDVEFTTIHKQLNLKEKITANGTQLFLPDFSIQSKNPYLVIVDESSMVSNYKNKYEKESKSLWETIVDNANHHNTKFLFVGDFCQIPPVNEKKCVLDMPETQLKYNIKRFDLLKVVRQAQGSPIIQLATYIREHINHYLLDYDYKDIKTDKGNINIWNRLKPDIVLANIKELVTDPAYAKNSDFVRVVSYTNKSNENLNHLIRNMIFNINSQQIPLVINEKLIANKPIFTRDPFDHNRYNLAFTTSDEFNVLAFKTVIDKGNKPDGSDTFKCFKVTVIDSLDETMEITIIHPSDKRRYDAFLEGIANAAKATYNKQLWRYFYNVQKRFANVSYAYTLTGHKSQGSTFTHCIVVENDIYTNRDHLERNKILYVAYTRPTDTLNLIK